MSFPNRKAKIYAWYKFIQESWKIDSYQIRFSNPFYPNDVRNRGYTNKVHLRGLTADFNLVRYKNSSPLSPLGKATLVYRFLDKR